MNREFKENKYSNELNTRIYLGLNMLLVSGISLLTNLQTGILSLTIMNLIVIALKIVNNNGKINLSNNNLLSEVMNKSNLAVIIGASYIAMLFKMINPNYTLYLIIGLQILNFSTTLFHFMKERIYSQSRYILQLSKHLDRLSKISIIGFIILFQFFDKVNLTIASIIVYEIIQILIQNERFRMNDFSFVYRILVVVITQYFYLQGIVSIEILFYTITMLFYFINFRYGKIFVLDPRSLQSRGTRS